MRLPVRFKDVTTYLRHDLKYRLRKSLEKHSSPRSGMFLILLCTGTFGFITSKVLFELAHVNSMAVRYPISVLLSYGFFLSTVYFWISRLRSQKHVMPNKFELEGIDQYAFSIDSPVRTGKNIRQYDDLPDVSIDVKDVVDLSVDENSIVAVIFLIFLPLFAVAVILIWLAPVLFAELLMIVVLTTSFSHRIGRVSQGSIFMESVRLTWRYFTILIVLMATSGFLLQMAFPDALTIGDLLKF